MFVDGIGQVPTEIPESTAGSTRQHPNQIITGHGAHGSRLQFGHHSAQPAADPVPDNRTTHAAADCVGHPQVPTGTSGIGRPESNLERPAANGAAVTAESPEIVSVAESADQADNRARPLWRLLLIMARPARVRIRLRKPCLRARLRTFGW